MLPLNQFTIKFFLLDVHEKAAYRKEFLELMNKHWKLSLRRHFLYEVVTAANPKKCKEMKISNHIDWPEKSTFYIPKGALTLSKTR